MSDSTLVALALSHCSGKSFAWWVSVSDGSCCAAFSGTWSPRSLCCCFAGLRPGMDGACSGQSSVSWGPPTQAGRAQGTGADVYLHAISSSAAWTPASDKSICPLSVSLQGKFESSVQHRQPVNFACFFLLMEKMALPSSSTKGQPYSPN